MKLVKKENFLDKYKVLLFDIDDTLLSFEKAEVKALSIALRKQHVKPTKEILEDYHKINLSYWKKVELKEISRDECLIKRFEEFLPKYNISISANEFEDLYRFHLNNQHFLIDNAIPVLKCLKKDFQIFAVSNGVLNTQLKRLKEAKIYDLFDRLYISEAIGYNKPDIRFFDAILMDFPELVKKETIIIGDSLTSDIKLGNNCNIDTCWFNLHNEINDSEIKPTYEIHELLELVR